MTAPIVVHVKRFRCPFCPRSYSARAGAVGHIERCWRNPTVRACKTCVHFEPATDAGPCVPGECCDCGVTPEACAVGVDLSAGLRHSCPTWAGR